VATSAIQVRFTIYSYRVIYGVYAVIPNLHLTPNFDSIGAKVGFRRLPLFYERSNKNGCAAAFFTLPQVVLIHLVQYLRSVYVPAALGRI